MMATDSAVVAIGVGEVPAPQNSIPMASKKPASTSARSAQERGLALGRVVAVDIEADRLRAERVQGEVVGDARVPRRPEPAKTIEQPPRVDAGFVGRESRGGNDERQQRRGLAAKPRVDRQHALEASEEQAGADEQHERNSHLRDDQRVAPPQVAGPASAGRVALERRHEVGPRALPGRDDAEQRARDARDRQRERQDCPVRPEIESDQGSAAAGRARTAHSEARPTTRIRRTGDETEQSGLDEQPAHQHAARRA